MLFPAGRLRLTLGRAMLALLVLLAAAAALLLSRAGTYLDESDPLEKSDVIYVLAGPKVERWLEGADLYKSGWAPIVLLSPGLVEDAELQLRARGIPFPTDSELAQQAMAHIGIPPSAILAPREPVDNTAQEAALLRTLAAEHGWHSAIIVTSRYHARRAAFAFRRALEGTGIRTAVHPSRYDSIDPAHWWRHRSDIRYVTGEVQKLLAYRLGLAE